MHLKVWLFIVLAVSPFAAANGNFVNGSFETSDYTGWTLWEGGASTDPISGTWGIAFDGQTINPGENIFDYFDGVNNPALSFGFPITYVSTDGTYLALQAQLGPQTHRMYQDITVGSRAKKLSFDMQYQTWFPFYSGQQELIVSILDVNDNLIEILFQTIEGQSPYAIPMTTFEFDIKDYRNQTIRFDITMVVNTFFLDAAFDNFNIERSAVPPGWDQGLKNGWVGDMPPGLEALPPGFEDGNKTGWND